MPDTKISAATATTPPLATDMLPLARSGDTTVRRVTVGNLIGQGGTTAARPATPALHQVYFDTDLALPVWWNGAYWVTAAGEIHLNVRDLGAVGNGVTDDTAAIQAALNAGGAAYKRVITIPASANPYILKVSGANTFTSLPGHKRCLIVTYDNTELVIMPGAVLKLASGEQTNAGGPVDLIVISNRNDVILSGGGRITGNTAGQTGWTDGYQQGSNGVIINGCGNCHTVTIQDLTLDDHFSNPINFELPAVGDHTNVVLSGLTGLNCGEGFQLCGVNGAQMLNCAYTDTASVSEGDSFEFAGCTNWLCDGCTHIFPAGYALGGSGFDLTGSQYGTLSNFIANGGNSGVAIQCVSYRAIHDVIVRDGVISNLVNGGTGVEISNQGFNAEPINVTISNLTISPLNLRGAMAFQIASVEKVTGPITISNCDLTNCSQGYLVRTVNHLTISGGSVDGAIYGFNWAGYENSDAAADVADINLTGIAFSNSTAYDVIFTSNGGETGADPTGTISGCTFTPNADTSSSKRMNFQTNTMLDMVVTGAAPAFNFGFLWGSFWPWGYAVLTPFNARIWLGMLQGTFDQVLEVQFSDTTTFTDKTQAGGTNFDLAGSVNYVGSPGSKLWLKWNKASLTWIEQRRA